MCDHVYVSITTATHSSSSQTENEPGVARLITTFTFIHLTDAFIKLLITTDNY